MHQHDTDALYIALVETLGADCVSLDAAVAEAHAGDWSDAPRVRPRMTLLPRTPEDVARALRVLGEHRQAVVVQGGLTGLAGGATPQAGEVALSLARVNAIESFDRIGGTLTVQAGVPLEQLQTFVEAEGWFFPLDLGARGTCQIGGNAATNAGGNRVIRFGTMRDLILGLEVALPDGTMLSMLNRVTKNTTGIDLKQLFIGSEGTLGVITRIVLKLEPKPSAANTALCAVASFDDATRLLKYLRARLANLSSFELMWQDFMCAAMDIAHLKAPFSDAYPVYVLIETLGESDLTYAFADPVNVMPGTATAMESIVGRQTRRVLRAGLTMRNDDVRAPILVTKGTTVTMIFDAPGITLTATGKAMSEGGMGETVTVQNPASYRQITAIVTGPGTVKAQEGMGGVITSRVASLTR